MAGAYFSANSFLVFISLKYLFIAPIHARLLVRPDCYGLFESSFSVLVWDDVEMAGVTVAFSRSSFR